MMPNSKIPKLQKRQIEFGWDKLPRKQKKNAKKILEQILKQDYSQHYNQEINA